MKTEIEALKRFSFRQFLLKKLIDIELILNRDLQKIEVDAIMQYKKIQACKHELSELRIWFRNDGVQYVKFQCLDCGVRHGPLHKLDEHEGLTHGNEDLHAVRDRVNQITYSVYTETARRISESAQKQRDPQTQIKRQKHYQAYMGSDAWRQKRLLVLERDQHKCQARMKGCTIRAEQVHHVSYEYLGDEPLWDLQSVCLNCHRRIHN